MGSLAVSCLGGHYWPLFQFLAALIFLRQPVDQPGSWVASAVSGGSIMVSGVAMNMAPQPVAWPPALILCFVLAGIWAMVSLSCLGRSFAILPAVRQTVHRGPYRWIRHPAYAGEMAMVAACALACPPPKAVLILALTVPLVAARILIEERTLQAAPGYSRYLEQVRYRLIPGVW